MPFSLLCQAVLVNADLSNLVPACARIRSVVSISVDAGERQRT